MADGSQAQRRSRIDRRHPAEHLDQARRARRHQLTLSLENALLARQLSAHAERTAAELERRYPQPSLFPDGNPGLGYAMAMGMVVIMAISITVYTLLQRRSERWLRS